RRTVVSRFGTSAGFVIARPMLKREATPWRDKKAAQARHPRGFLSDSRLPTLDYLPFELPPIFLPAVPFFAARLAAFASVAAADSVAADSAFLLPRSRSAAARSRPPTPLVFGFSASLLASLSALARGSNSLPISSTCATSALSPLR